MVLSKTEDNNTELDLLESFKSSTKKKPKGKTAVSVKVKKQPGLQLPQYKTAGAAGCDIHANNNLPIWVSPGETALIPTGLFLGIPEGYEVQIRPRSGLALEKGITVLNSPGTIDSDYRHELGVILINHGKNRFEVKKGDRIAQLVLQKFERVDWNVVDELDKTDRKGGFNSTGVRDETKAT